MLAECPSALGILARMYVPAHFSPSESMIRDLLARPGLCDLVTIGSEGLESTPIPLHFDAEAGERGALTGHMGLVNPQWRVAESGPAEALVIVHGPQHYMSASWRPSGALIGGGTVPTWNYLILHVRGELSIHRDAEWLIAHLGRVSADYEEGMASPWSIERMDQQRLTGQLRALVGIEVRITDITAKAKLAQNLSEPERAAVVSELRERGDEQGAAALEEAWASHKEAMHPWLQEMRAR